MDFFWFDNFVVYVWSLFVVMNLLWSLYIVRVGFCINLVLLFFGCCVWDFEVDEGYRFIIVKCLVILWIGEISRYDGWGSVSFGKDVSCFLVFFGWLIEVVCVVLMFILCFLCWWKRLWSFLWIFFFVFREKFFCLLLLFCFGFLGFLLLLIFRLVLLWFWLCLVSMVFCVFFSMLLYCVVRCLVWSWIWVVVFLVIGWVKCLRILLRVGRCMVMMELYE